MDIRDMISHKRTKNLPTISLRGYDRKTWAPPELSHIRLPVNLLAYNRCPTHRDVYLKKIENKTLKETWSSYQGRVIDHLLKSIHKKISEYVSNTSLSELLLFEHILSNQNLLIEEAKEKYMPIYRQIQPLTNHQQKIDEFDSGLCKIVRMEAEISGALIDYRISKKFDVRKDAEAEQLFPFLVDITLTARKLGFSDPVTPDFIYRGESLAAGDIKTGPWEEFYSYTFTAYALAYEYEHRQDINFGIILHTDIPPNRQVPIYKQTDINIISDSFRKKFIAVRNHKLEIVDKAEDPGKPSQDRCDPNLCGYYQECWG